MERLYWRDNADLSWPQAQYLVGGLVAGWQACGLGQRRWDRAGLGPDDREAASLIYQGHTSPVYIAAWSPDGSKIASGDAVRWRTGMARRVAVPHAIRRIRAVAWRMHRSIRLSILLWNWRKVAPRHIIGM